MRAYTIPENMPPPFTLEKGKIYKLAVQPRRQDRAHEIDSTLFMVISDPEKGTLEKFYEEYGPYESCGWTREAYDHEMNEFLSYWHVKVLHLESKTTNYIPLRMYELDMTEAWVRIFEQDENGNDILPGIDVGERFTDESAVDKHLLTKV